MDQNVLKISKDARRSREKLDQSSEEIRKKLEQQVFINRVEANRNGHLHDVARGQ